MMMMVMIGIKIGYSQVSSGDVNGEIRELLSKIKFPNNHNPFFYDFVEHVTDERWFVCNDTIDTNNFMNWYTIFDELKYSAHDTTLLPNTMKVYKKSENICKRGEIPIGIISVDYDIFKSGVFNNQGEYFIWNDDYVIDVLNRVNSPFESRSLFSSSILKHNTYFKDVKFRIDPNLIFHDSTYRYLNGSVALEKLYIDFGDGNGWQYVDESYSHTVNVSYPTSGTYEVKFGYFICDPYPNCSINPSRFSKSYITVLNDVSIVYPNNVYDDIPGITYGIYEGCNTSINKKVIFIEGFDMYNSKNIEESYAEFFNDDNTHLKSLQAYDYNVVIVNWDNCNKDVRANALSIVRLLEKFKSELSDDENEQFIIVGNSLGGITARLALNYMESDDYKNGKSIQYISDEEDELISPMYIKTGLMHNTRLLVTIDSGFEGVYIPVATQHAIKKIKDINSTFPILGKKGFFPIAILVDNASKTYNVLQSMALKQLLIYHINNYVERRGTMSYHKMVEKYTLDTLVYNYKANNNGMPEFCKITTITSGLLNGGRQTDWFGKELKPGYNLANIDFNLKKKIFRVIERQVFNLKFSMYALPDYNTLAKTFDYTATYNKFKLRGCFKKLITGKGDCVNTDIIDTDFARAEQTIPYEIISGGNVNFFKLLTSENFNADENDFFVFAYQYYFNATTQSISGNFSYGLLTSKNISLSIKSDALIFNFIPVKSSLGIYPDDKNVEINIYKLKNSEIFKHTGSDLISGFSKGISTPNSRNQIHSYLENKNLINSKIVLGKHNKILQREIGDNILKLDNFKVNRKIQITINDTLFLGRQNNEYDYIQCDESKIANKYYLSRGEPLVIDNGGFIYVNSNNNVEIDLTNCINCQLNNNIIYNTSSLVVCNNLLKVAQIQNIPNINTNTNTNSILIYPNPTSDNLNISLNEKIKKIIIKNMNGDILNNINSKLDTNEFILNTTEYLPGMYIIEIFTNDNLYINKFIKTN